MIDKPNLKYSHVFVVLRVDLTFEGVRLQDAVTVTKVFRAEEAATEEARRLNELNADKGCQYFVQLGRMARNDLGSDGSDEGRTPILD